VGAGRVGGVVQGGMQPTPPYALTEHGATAASSILKSRSAVKMSTYVNTAGDSRQYSSPLSRLSDCQ